ncbi:MAG: hypothetical protein HY680_09685 [Chloroflexi bacterium]|nr:hypothetical protein [Chloroflexota bacterium]
MTTSTKWLIGIGGALAVLVIVAVAVALTNGRKPPTYAEDTPEGITQRYLQALAEDDTTRAYGYLSADLQKRCNLEDWRRSVSFGRRQIEESGVLLKEVKRPRENEAEVLVTFSEVQVGRPFPVPPREYSFEQRFMLKLQDDGAWRFSETPWPSYCPEPVKPREPVPATP